MYGYLGVAIALTALPFLLFPDNEHKYEKHDDGYWLNGRQCSGRGAIGGVYRRRNSVAVEQEGESENDKV